MRQMRQATARNSAPKRAMILNPKQYTIVLSIAEQSLHAARDIVGIMLSYRCGLRAQEIAWLEWERHLLDAQGNISDTVRITTDLGKWGKYGEVPIPPDVKAALEHLRAVFKGNPPKYVFYRLDGDLDQPLTPNAVVKWFGRFYELIGFQGCTSHSGRRTFGTRAARKAALHECSIADVSKLLRHSSLTATLPYLEHSEGQRSLVAALMADDMVTA